MIRLKSRFAAVLPRFLCLIFLLTIAQPATAGNNTEAASYELSLSFAPGEDSGQLIGTAKIEILPAQNLELAFPRIIVTGALLQDATGRESELVGLHDALILPPADIARTLYLSYKKTVAGEPDNLIHPGGISLTSNWYPMPHRPMRMRVTANLPENFTAITEADSFPLLRKGNTVESSYRTPTATIHFVAGPYTIHKRQVRENLFVHSMFFPEDANLAESYLQAAAHYLTRYEREIGPYPYNHYVIVANRQPTGYGMPTFTLLGQQVLRLPFIKDTSLGHEIVHSWFGNAVEVDYSGGNWCEGLTAFLADHAYREEKGEGRADRKESITRYLSYVSEEAALPLGSFTSASHSQALAEAKRTVGYNRGALFFHELRERIGHPAFGAGLQQFYTAHKGRRASWDDLRESFAAAATTNLDTFFAERLKRTDIPALAIDDVTVSAGDNRSVLHFTLRQTSEKPYTLRVPLRIKTAGGDKNVAKEITEKETRLSLGLEQRPLELTVDPDHDFLRMLTPEELPPVWSHFLGAEKKLVILSRESDRELFQPLLHSLEGKELIITTAEKVGNQDLRDNNLLFLGTDQAPARSLFGPPAATDAGLVIDVRRNPLSPPYVAVLITSNDRKNTPAVIGRLSHYGKYSYLEFRDGRNSVKRIQPTQSGIRAVLEELPAGGAVASLGSFQQIVEQLEKARVVYVGESHTSFADHLLQLRIIEALYAKNPQLAIGMEMFPASAQPVLDQYTLGDGSMDENTFLKSSEYFDVWQYDYRYFREILNFARARKIPVLGLNLDRQIVSEVFRSGSTDGLSPEIRASLPRDRDLGIAGYAERLAQVHDMHVQGRHGSGLGSGFLQAQALWDEVMAENIAGYLTLHPNHRMVVLAGAQHTRKDSGIPPRVARRLPIPQVSVLNVFNGSQPANIEQLTDYFFLAAEQELPEIPKIGIVLGSETKDDKSYLKIEEISPHGKAAAAGLTVGDLILRINGRAVEDMTDLRIAMLDAKEGDFVAVHVIRGDSGEDRQLEFQVELTLPPTTRQEP